jgi:branched-chain amino acid transport system permease protein
MTTSYRKERIDRGIKARSDDIFALASYREALYLLVPRVLPVALMVILPAVLMLIGEEYWVKVIIMCCVFGILALSWDFMHSAGLLSLGHALFFGIGAYISGALNYYLKLPVYICIPLATVFGAALSTLLLLPVLRLRGIYFGMISFALSLMLARIVEATHILGGTEGLSGLSTFPSLWLEVYIVIAAVLFCLFFFRRLINSDYGLVFRGMMENDRAVMSGGINIYWFKIQALFIGTAVAAFIGAFMAHYTRIVGMSAFAMDYSILPVACVILGGPGTFAGPLLGAFLLVPVSELLRAFGTMRVVFYCVVLAVFVVAVPEGIFHFIQRRYHQFERKVEVEAQR